MSGNNVRLLILNLNIFLIFGFLACKNDQTARRIVMGSSVIPVSTKVLDTIEEYPSVNALLVLPKNPVPGEPFRIVVTGGKNIPKAQIIVTGPEGELKSLKRKTGEEFPFWRIDDYPGSSPGIYNVTVVSGEMVLSNLGSPFPKRKRQLSPVRYGRRSGGGTAGPKPFILPGLMHCFMTATRTLPGLHCMK
jgi:hypothetical protein